MESIFRANVEISEFRKIIGDLLQNIMCNNCDKSNESMSNYKLATVEITALLIKTEFSSNQIKENLLNQNFDINKIECFLNLVKERRPNLIKASVNEHNAAFGDVVTDTNWKLKLILGTNTYHKMQYPILEIDFRTLNTMRETNLRKFEFTKTELDKLIKALETVF